jgi:hypothetical protein
VSGIQAARAAAFLKKELGVDAVLVAGRYGELSVLVDGEEVIDGGALALLGVLPSLRRIRDAVAAKLGPPAGPAAQYVRPNPNG